MTKKTSIKLPRSLKRKFPQVKEIHDATKAVEIPVNRQDCKIARKQDPTECALAKAAKRELKVDGVIIGISTSYLIKDDKAIRFDTPESVRREIVSFDRHQDFEPGEYHLMPKAPTKRLGRIEKRRNRAGGKNKNDKRKYHHSARVRIVEKGME